jgi:hypothetical protein
MSAIDLVTSRLDPAHLKRQGKGWVARCPAHADKGPSLSINEGDDGRVLLHCFAGCSVHDVVAAIGLSVVDLFDRTDWREEGNLARLNTRRAAREADWAAALNVLGAEAGIVGIAASDVADGKALSTADHERLILSIRRINAARSVLNGH